MHDSVAFILSCNMAIFHKIIQCLIEHCSQRRFAVCTDLCGFLLAAENAHALYLSVFHCVVVVVTAVHVLQCLYVSPLPYLPESVHESRVRVCFSLWLVTAGRISDRTRCSVKALS